MNYNDEYYTELAEELCEYGDMDDSEQGIVASSLSETLENWEYMSDEFLKALVKEGRRLVKMYKTEYIIVDGCLEYKD